MNNPLETEVKRVLGIAESAPASMKLVFGDHDDLIRRLWAENEALRTEMDEQCRIIGAGGSRELALMTKVEQQRKVIKVAAEALNTAQVTCDDVVRREYYLAALTQLNQALGEK